MSAVVLINNVLQVPTVDDRFAKGRALGLFLLPLVESARIECRLY